MPKPNAFHVFDSLSYDAAQSPQLALPQPAAVALDCMLLQHLKVASAPLLVLVPLPVKVLDVVPVCREQEIAKAEVLGKSIRKARKINAKIKPVKEILKTFSIF